jgi:hyperosmotically inducible protein
MRTKSFVACLLATALLGPALVVAAVVDGAHPAQYVKDSAITAAVKTKLAGAHLANLTQVKVDTDRDGVVWLSGTAQSREVADQAVQIAKTTDGVISVKNQIVVTPEAK